MPRSRRALLASTAAVAIGALAGCSRPFRGSRPGVTPTQSDAWATRHGGSSRTRASDAAAVSSDPAHQWRDTDFPQYDGGVFTAAGGGFVVDTHTVTAVAPDGSVRWRDDTGYYGQPLLTRDAVVVAAMDGSLVALDRASGERAWTGAEVSPTALAAGRILGADGSETVAAARPGGGTAWTRRSAHADYVPAVACGEETVLAAFTYRHQPRDDTTAMRNRSTVVAYDAGSGDVQWQFGVPGAVERLAVRNGRVYVGAGIRDLGAVLSVLSLSEGRVAVRRTFLGAWLDGLTVTADRAVAAAGTTLVGFDERLDGRVWSESLPARPSSLATAASLVYATWSEPTDETVVAAFDAADGEREWQVTLTADWGYVAGVTDGRVFVATNDETGLHVLE
ncbi:outer membrane protein assembly factor BamB family protein [Halobacterium sp. KA-6]|uniref:outer membrane protein assembly factor BamB family protein n=1 Tax=Halobacterium sp. KA-6 TaxID=2896368 RepID=UPI001E41FCB9|nr:PQQ-binding-like beta-propeller repeat protein [Halobacterium sp. KA-6]MCD2202322.1 PQQ-like beta-propeller repeat protein [Halobacterium sp. KA-6]